MKHIHKIILGVLLFLLLYPGVSAVEVEITTDLSFITGCTNTSCDVGTGFTVVKNVMGGIIKYFTYIAGLGAVLFIVINGVMYSMAGINDGLKSAAKERIMKTLIGLVILMLSGVILNAIAPWIYK